MDATQIPIIDMALLKHKADGQRTLATAVDRALTEIGFFVVVGHGLEWSRIEAAAAICREFFDQPQAVKEAVANHGVPFKGYLKIEEAPGGLRVKTRAGQWVGAPIVDQGLVVNIGDLMMTWTNDRWLSNMHRVVNPPCDTHHSIRRQSMVYFVNCNPDARIECLPSRQSRDNPPRHSPIGAGEHRRMKLAKSAQVVTTSPTLRS